MAMRTKLVRRLLVLSVAGVVVVGGAGGFYGYRKAQIRRQYATYRAQGLDAAAHGQRERALELLSKVLQREPNDVEALVQYARIRPEVPLPKAQHLREAIGALRHLVKIDPNPAADRRELLDLYVRTGYWTEARALADELLPPGAHPGVADVPIVAARTRALIGLRETIGAYQSARQWSALAPADVDAQVLLLQLLHETGRYADYPAPAGHRQADEADVAQALAAAAQPLLPATDPRPAMIRGEGLFLAGRWQEAAAQFRAAVAMDLKISRTAEVLVAQLDQVGAADQSIEVLRRVQQLRSDDVIVRNALARRLWEIGDYAGVGNLLNKIDAADAATDSELIALRASAAARLKDAATAGRLRDALAARHADPTAIAWSVVLDPGAPDLKRLIAACGQALQAAPSPYLQYFLAEALWQGGETDLAVDAWRKAADETATWPAPRVRLAEALLSAGRYEEAVLAAREAALRSPAGAMVYLRARDEAIDHGHASDADRLLADVDRIAPDVRDQGQLLCIKVHLLALKPDTRTAAAEAIRAAVNDRATPLSRDALLRLAVVSHASQLGTEGICYERCERDHGLTAQLALSRASVALLDGHADQALKAFEADRARATEAQRPDWSYAWAQLLEAANDPRARAEIEHVADAQPASSQIQMFALNARSTRDDAALRQRVTRRLHDMSGDDGLVWKLARARELLLASPDRPDRAGAGEAATLLADVIRITPNAIQAHVLLAEANRRLDRINDAVEQEKIATGLDPTSVSLGLRLASDLQRRGDADAAREELARVRALSTATPAELRSGAALAMQLGDAHLALSFLSAVPAGGSDDLLTAQVDWMNGKRAEAESICRRLLEHPDLTTIRFAAGMFAAEGHMDEATAALARLDTLKLAAGQKELARAEFAERYLGADAALVELERAAATAPPEAGAWPAIVALHLTAGHPKEALSALDRALGQFPADHALQALAHVRDLLASADDPTLRPLAIAMVRDPQNAAAAEAAMRLILKDRPNKADPHGLASDLDELAGKDPRCLPLQLAAVEADLNAGMYDEAAATASRAARQFPSAAEPQARFVAVLRAQDRWPEVLAEAQKWRDRSMDNPLAPDLQMAEAYLRLHRPADAMAQLDPYMQNAKAAPRQAEAALPAYAAARHAAGAGDVAPLLRPWLDQDAAGRERWMLFALGNLGPDEAPAWLASVDPHIPPGATAEQVTLATTWMMLGKRDGAAADIGKARDILRPLAERPDAAPATLLAMGMCAEAAADWRDAERYYRRGLAANAADFVAANNLAMVLAKQGGDLAEAMGLIGRAIAQRPDVPALYDTRAFIEGRMKRYADAAESEQAAIRLRPREPQYRLSLARLLLDGGQSAQAARALRDIEALRLDVQGHPEMRRQLEDLRTAVKDGGRQASTN